ncbi:MAG: glycosyltransferase [Halanaerobiales bacterium]|nr:glycosyltransferase [Halanaerobiales bacterium]
MSQIIASVIIPTFNRKDLLRLSLLSFNQQDFSKDKFEVIVIDDGSTDDSFEMLMSLQVNYSLKILRNESNKGAGAARNIGIKNSRGQVIIFSDSDFIVPTNFISGHMKHHNIDKNIGLCGLFSWRKVFAIYFSKFTKSQKYEFEEARNKTPLFQKKLKMINFKYNDGTKILSMKDLKDIKRYSYIPSWSKGFLGEVVDEYGPNLKGFAFPWLFFGTGNASIRKENLLNVGGFDEELPREEDWELGYRLYKSGIKFRYESEIESIHQEHVILSEHREKTLQSNKIFFQKHQEIIVLLTVLNLENSFDWLTLSQGFKEYQMLKKRGGKFKFVIEKFDMLVRKRAELFVQNKKTSNDQLMDIRKEMNILNPVRQQFKIFIRIFRELVRGL